MLPHRVIFWLAMLAGISIAPSALAQESGDDDEPFFPGLAATYRDDKGQNATRLDSQVAFHWGEASPDPRLGAGEFRVRWQGNLLAMPRGEYRFFAYGSGEVELKIAGRTVIARQTMRKAWLSSAAVTLTFDYHPLELSFRRTEKDAALMLLWSGPGFGREPIPARALYHPRTAKAARTFERGRFLARTLRCGRCHGDEQPPPPAPALDRLSGNLSRAWLVHWLSAGEQTRDDRSPRRMPGFGLSTGQAESIADALLPPRESVPSSLAPKQAKPNRKAPKPDAKKGEELFLTLGCLACHTWRDLGASGWMGGGDLTHIADKRPASFFADWLDNPARLNRDHRMPVFPLSRDERTALALFLAEQKATDNKPRPQERPASDQAAKGHRLIAELGCATCHRLPEAAAPSPQPLSPLRGERGKKSPQPSPPGGGEGRVRGPRPRLNERSNWERACTGAADPAKHRPGYRLSAEEARAVRLYYSGRRWESRDGLLLLAENNCLACHARDGTREAIPLLPPLLADKLAAVVRRYPHLAPLTPALTPPALNSVGDKLTDTALAASIARRGEAHRPYLRVRMPRFPLSEEDLQTLVHHLIAIDRVPPSEGSAEVIVTPAQRERYVLAGGRLVSSDGFGCTSCHAVGGVVPASDSLHGRGPDLAMLQRRIRRPWFDRWVRNPARIVPRMEMPSVQLPVAGLLDGKLDEQLAAVWHVLNRPGFEPPLPNPVRTLRHSGNHSTAEPIVVTDLVQLGKQTRVRPFLVGLANRHSVLFDLERGGLSQWRVGDAARQHSRGKGWFWEPAGNVLLDTALAEPDLSLSMNGRELAAWPLVQFVAEADAWQTDGPAAVLHYRLAFGLASGADKERKPGIVCVRRKWTPLPAGFVQELSVDGIPEGATAHLHLLSASSSVKPARTSNGRTIRLGDRFGSRIVLAEPVNAKFAEDGRGVSLNADKKGTLRVLLRYESEVPVDRFPDAPQAPPVAGKVEPVEIAPGFVGQRLPLPADIMPTGLCWRPNGRLVFSSLKGQVFEAVDTDRDGIEDRLRILADGVPAPYGVHADGDYVDISAKYALLRLQNESKSRRRIDVVASGWGYSADYHDWAVGLPRNGRGEYFLGIPCQQDKRSAAAARFHGHVLRLTPRQPTREDPRRFALASLSSGHRFPMGLALDRDGELFVTDNQGNYKPFNELNHVRPGAHFGFINYLERGKPAPPRTPPAIDIPHPWTRSVNGICFLYTPKALRAELAHDVFGPLEGHLIGCEYDTRRLIRLTLQRVGDTFQGAAYPLSIPQSDPRRGFLGPLVCAVSPRGELYVGSIRDSGWGAGNNVGEIVRVQIQPDKLPCGIAEVRATHNGFQIDFFRPIHRERAARTDSYTIQSYRREATPAYGAPDRDRRTEKVTAASVSANGRSVTLKLAEMRPGFVYELRLKNLTPDGGDFHPAEAHYTLRVLPK